MEIDNREIIVFQNDVFTIVKKQYDTDCGLSSFTSNDRIVPIVQSGDTRYWIKDNEGNYIGGAFCEKYGCKSFLNPTLHTVAVEFSDNCWRVITADKRCIPSAYQTLGDITSIDDFIDGYAEIRLINGISSYLNIDGDCYMKSLSGEYKRVPKKFFGGMFLSNNLCVFLDGEQMLHLYDGELRPIRIYGDVPLECKEVEATPLPWLVVLKFEGREKGIAVINTDTLSVVFFGWNGLESIDYKKITDKCLYLKAHTKNEESGSVYWNKSYVEKDYYSIVFYNGKMMTSSEDFLVDKKNRIIITQQVKDNSCYSLNGEVVLNNLYDTIHYDKDTHLFSLKYNEEDFVADNSGRLHVVVNEKSVCLPRQVVAYEEISETIYKVAHYQSDLYQSQHGLLKYGLLDISTLEYIIPCRYSSLQYVSDSIIIVSGEEYNSWGVIDIYGGQRMPQVFNRIEQCAGNSFHFQPASSDSYFADSNLMKPIEAEEGTYKISAYYTVQPFYGEKDYGTNKYNHKKYHRGFCVVSVDGKYGLLDKDGIEVIACANDAIYCFYESENELFVAVKRSCSIFVIELLSGRRFVVETDSIDDCYKSSDGCLFFLTSTTTEGDEGAVTLHGLYNLNNGWVYKQEYSHITPVGDWDNHGSRTYPPGNLVRLYKESYDFFALAKYDGTILTDFVFKGDYIDKNSFLICNTNDSYDYDNKHITIYSGLGECIVPLDANMEDYEVTPEGLIKACCKSEKFGLTFRIYNIDGKQLTKKDYSYIGPFKDGEALVNIGGNAFIAHDDFDGKRYSVRGGLFGVISIDFLPLIEPKYTIVRRNCDGLRVVSERIDDQHLYGLVSFDGRCLIDCKYQYLGDACKGQLLFAKNGRWTNSGSKREALYTADRRNRWLIDANWGIIDEDDTILVPASFQYIYRPIDEVSVVVNNNKYGFYNYDQKMFFIPQYDFLEAFSEGVCVVGKVDKETGQMRYGYIDKANHIVIPIQYLKAFHFKNGYANVETEDAYCSINMNNEIVRSQDKAELARWRAEEAEERARAIEEEEDRRQMIEDGLREAFNGDMSNMWNID